MPNQLRTFSIKDWVVLGRNRFKPPFKISDNLINEARIVHVVKGRSVLHAANQQISLNDGDTIIMKADNFINNWMANTTEELNVVIAFQLTSDLLKEVYQSNLPQWYLDQPDKQVFPVKKVEEHKLMTDFFRNLQYYLDHPSFISEEWLRIKIKEILHILIRIDHNNSTRQIFEALFNPNEYEFQEVIQAHLFDDLNLEDLAFLTGLSLSSFKRKFSAIYGTSPNKYFISKRLEKAQVLLRTTDQRISEIAYDCGYTDVGYFTKTFQKNYNCTPSEFRERLLG